MPRGIDRQRDDFNAVSRLTDAAAGVAVRASVRRSHSDSIAAPKLDARFRLTDWVIRFD